ncbi:SWIM zinc finger family protein [Paenibacillus sp. 19GGS1-52]|uniref:SWIM zinc finger family protein n=1 Tax=Paenibacillus sp. 19GGS1-52 TaxID=2758563 RepID=UPI001EFB1B6B|nr:SWIM zinc finger family protein [Paenibacillus sp. 19GGS1-52]ULO05314.1 SWIM zinc finger family protein [Paenibacillus sp. 19GGS1-52]
MLQLTASYIDSLAPNAAAIKNGQGLVKKKSLVQLNCSETGELLFGECSGSGKSNYVCSVDFIIQDKPVYRCTCPSRQFPCKHVLGLMYAYSDGMKFTVAAIPEDISVKREKAEKREETKAEQESGTAELKPKKVNKSALKKKITAQLEGLDVLEKLILSLIRSGLGTIDNKMLKNIHEHVKQMGNYYLSGAQTELRRFALLLADDRDREESYTYAAEQLTELHAFIKKGRAYLINKQEDPELTLDHESTMEEWLGHAWQLTELKAFGKVREGVELLQLAFFSYDDAARQEFVDHGYWLELLNGEIHRTVQYRPHKAAKHLREDDSFFEIAQISMLYKYPGEMNARVRYEQMTPRPVTAGDVAEIGDKAHRSYAEVIKKVKNQLKNPLSDKTPVLLLHAAKLGRTASGQFAITDESGYQLVLEDISALPEGTVGLLPYLDAAQVDNSSILVMFEHRMDQGRLVAQPLTIVKDAAITRLLY